MKGKEMVVFKEKFHVLELILLLLNLSIPISISKEYEQPISYCGSIKIQKPFHLQHSPSSSSSSSASASILSKLLLCKSQKLYFRTSLGLFQISSINYSSKLLTISHSSCSSTYHFISSTLLTSGFPPPPQPNSLVFFNCSSSPSSSYSVPFLHINCTDFINGCGGPSSSSSQCLLLEDDGIKLLDLMNLFHPKEMNCTHYSRIHRTAAAAADNDDGGGFELGTRISFDIPDHMPNPCNECKKPHGNCGVVLRCICHLNQCKDKVLSNGVIIIISPSWATQSSINLISFIFVMFILKFNQP